MRNDSLSYTKISEITVLSRNTIKSFLRRDDEKSKNELLCKNCCKSLGTLSRKGIKNFGVTHAYLSGGGRIQNQIEIV